VNSRLQRHAVRLRGHQRQGPRDAGGGAHPTIRHRPSIRPSSTSRHSPSMSDPSPQRMSSWAPPRA